MVSTIHRKLDVETNGRLLGTDGTRPALVAPHLIDEISRPELQDMLTTSNGLHAATHALTGDQETITTALHSVAFWSQSDPEPIFLFA
jgi:hypothetical protein